MTVATIYRSSDGTRWVRLYRSTRDRLSDERKMQMVGATVEPIAWGKGGDAATYVQMRLG